jgi:hypothetical protein
MGIEKQTFINHKGTEHKNQKSKDNQEEHCNPPPTGISANKEEKPFLLP